MKHNTGVIELQLINRINVKRNCTKWYHSQGNVNDDGSWGQQRRQQSMAIQSAKKIMNAFNKMEYYKRSSHSYIVMMLNIHSYIVYDVECEEIQTSV